MYLSSRPNPAFGHIIASNKKYVWNQNKTYAEEQLVDPLIHYITSVIALWSLILNKPENPDPCSYFITQAKVPMCCCHCGKIFFSLGRGTRWRKTLKMTCKRYWDNTSWVRRPNPEDQINRKPEDGKKVKNLP